MNESRRRFRPTRFGIVVTLIVASLCVGLGIWQLDRAQQKEALLAQIRERNSQGITGLDALLRLKDPDNYPVVVKGHFDNSHNILLDNRILKGQAGYYLLTPLKTRAGRWVLVNRGWLPRGESRETLPSVPAIHGKVTVRGKSYVPGRNRFIKETANYKHPHWPLRVQQLDMQALQAVLGVELAPFEIRVKPGFDLEAGDQLPREWKAVYLTPARHRGYAVQWFVMAAAVVLFYIGISFRRDDDGREEESGQ